MFFDSYDTRKRTLGIRDKQILYRNAKERCENPTCGKKIGFDEMQVGHKTAFSKGGATTIKNSACLCYRCNKLQGTDSWATFLKKQNVQGPKTAAKQSMKQALQGLTITELKALATKHGVKVQGRVEEDWFETRPIPPTKSQYVNKLSGVITSADLRSIPKAPAKKATAKRKPKSESFSWW